MCPKCVGDKISKKIRKSVNDFIKDARLIHGEKYNYHNAYQSPAPFVIITCSTHGDFKQHNQDHLRGFNCPSCGKLSSAEKRKMPFQAFIKYAQHKHGNKFCYEKSNYTNNRTKIEIVCPIHGSFFQTPRSHLKHNGCSKCKEISRGEIKIQQFLIQNQIIFERQKRILECKHKLPLPFDFYLPDYNLCIEFDGIQHILGWGLKKNKQKSLEIIQLRDEIKTNFCLNNSINLLRISHDKIEQIEELIINELSILTVRPTTSHPLLH